MKRLRAIGKALAVLVGGGSAAESAGLPIAGLPARPGPFASYQAPPPSPVGGLPLQGLESGGVGPRGGAGAASYDSAGFFVSASSYPANAPVEDRFDVRQWQAPAPPAERPGASAAPSPALLAAVFDGHGGWQAAEHARRVLLERLGEELSGGAAPSEAAATASALVRAFAHTERTFIDAIRPAYALGFGEVAHVGACALAAVLTQSTAVVANAGDCRAVLGHLCLGHPPEHRTAREGEAGVDGHAAAAAALLEATGGGGAKGALPTEVPGAPSTPPFVILPEPSWRWRRLAPLDPPPSSPTTPSAPAGSAAPSTLPLPPLPSPTGLPLLHPFYLAAIPMSLDNNAREAREKARLAAEHPGESDVIVCRKDSPTSCYVKSRLQPTRALGDAYLKYAEFNEDGGRFRGRHIRPPFTPPYISACVTFLSLPLSLFSLFSLFSLSSFCSGCSAGSRAHPHHPSFLFFFFSSPPFPQHPRGARAGAASP